MSTRSQLRFVDSSKDWTEPVQVYRHSDGYPESVLPALDTLRSVLADAEAERGPNYAAANFIFLMKLEGMRMYEGDHSLIGGGLDQENLLHPSEWDLDQPHFLLGYGVENPAAGIHGDEEYLYIVDVGVPGYAVSVSGHSEFPRWDESDDLPADETAFDHAAWQVKDLPLDAAIEELIPE